MSLTLSFTLLYYNIYDLIYTTKQKHNNNLQEKNLYMKHDVHNTKYVKV